MLIFVMGPQGSGKSTQGKLIAKELGLNFVSTGEIFRTLFAEHDELGIKAEEYWGHGELVPDELVFKVVKQYFSSHKDKKGFVVDGFPRKKSQYERLAEVFSEPIDAVVYLDLGNKTIKERLKKRWHTEHRQDERPYAMQRRLKLFEAETRPLLQLFINDGYTVVKCDARPPVEEIFTDIMSKLHTQGVATEK